jgi:hypothetical protein
MFAITAPVRKSPVSLPVRLVDFADREAARLSISRSRLIARALSEIKAMEGEQLAAEGCRFCAREASEFAGGSASAVAGVLEHAS